MKYKSKNKIDYRMVINSREIAVIGLVCTLFSGVATVAAAISGAGMATCILFGVFARAWRYTCPYCKPEGRLHRQGLYLSGYAEDNTQV